MYIRFLLLVHSRVSDMGDSGAGEIESAMGDGHTKYRGPARVCSAADAAIIVARQGLRHTPLASAWASTAMMSCCAEYT